MYEFCNHARVHSLRKNGKGTGAKRIAGTMVQYYRMKECGKFRNPREVLCCVNRGLNKEGHRVLGSPGEPWGSVK